MNQNDYRFEDLVAETRRRIPRLREALDQFYAHWKGEEFPTHLAFSEVVYEQLSSAASKNSSDFDELAAPLFAFLETMATHPDNNVRNVAYISFCEPLCADETVLQKSRKHIGPELLKFCDQIIRSS